MTATSVIVDGGDAGSWSLLVDRGDVLAVKIIPHNGQLYYSTEDKPNRLGKDSEFGLKAREVVRRFVDVSDCERPFGDLIDDVQVELYATTK